jgi:hypothetical protein
MPATKKLDVSTMRVDNPAEEFISRPVEPAADTLTAPSGVTPSVAAASAATPSEVSPLVEESSAVAVRKGHVMVASPLLPEDDVSFVEVPKGYKLVRVEKRDRRVIYMATESEYSKLAGLPGSVSYHIRKALEDYFEKVGTGHRV